MPKRVALVVPCYNEARRLKPEGFLECSRLDPSIFFQFVDDGSVDDTRSLLNAIVSEDREAFSVFGLDRHRGKAAAVWAGVNKILAGPVEIFGYWDSDLATPLSLLPVLVDCLETRGMDMVLASRVKLMGRRVVRRSFRHYTGRIFATLASLALRIPVYDTQCGAKVFRNDQVMRSVFADPFTVKWAFDVEILARYTRLVGSGQGGSEERLRIYEYPADEWTDVPGSRLSLPSSMQAVYDLFRIYRRYGRQDRDAL